jgi:hypothetical protein
MRKETGVGVEVTQRAYNAGPTRLTGPLEGPDHAPWWPVFAARQALRPSLLDLSSKQGPHCLDVTENRGHFCFCEVRRR